jgi:protein tyrosine phosphatase (PTP) superfamily phosphohydrolase (DUF442 family)
MRHLIIRHLLRESLWQSDLRLLLEDYRTEKITQMVNKRLPEKDQLSQEQLEQMIEADPTARKNVAGKYSEWIVKQYIDSDDGYKSRFFEDLYKYKNALKRFHELKVRNKIKEKDINKIKDLWMLQDLTKGDQQESVLEGFPDTSKLEANGEVEVILRDPQIHIYWTKTHNANTILGSNTEWCTVPKGSSEFNAYNKKGPIFILYIKEVDEIKRYQYHFESKQFMDEEDREDTSYLENAKIKNAFIKFAQKHKNPFIAVQFGDKSLFQDKEVQLAAMKQDGNAIKYIDNPSEEVQLAAVKQDGIAIKHIDNPSEEVQLAAVKQNRWVIDSIDNPSEEVQLAAVKQDGIAIEHIDNPSEEVQLAAVNQNGLAIYYIKHLNPSEEIQLAAVKQDGFAIKYIKHLNPSEEIQLAAVKQYGWAIRHIDNPSEEVQLAAVNQNGTAIRYIDNPSEEAQLAAVKQNGLAIEYIDNPSEEVQLAAVNQNGRAIEYIDNPSEEAQRSRLYR